MKIKIVIIISIALVATLFLGGFIVSTLNPNNRKSYKIHEENGEYYYRNRWDFLTRTLNEKVWITFEDDLALIHEYTVSWGKTSTITIWKYIDRSGKVVLRPDAYLADAFGEGLAAVMLGEGTNWGYINKQGEIVIEPQFGRASMFQNGVASVYIEKTGKWLLINMNGEHIQDLDEPLNWKSYTQADPKNDVLK